MRSAQSRLSVIASLGSARKGVGSCVEAVPVSARVLKVGGAVFGGLSGAVLLRSLFSRRGPRRSAPSVPAAPKALLPRSGMGRILFTEAVVTLLLPLCRYYLLGERTPVSDRIAPRLNRLFRRGH